MGAKANGRRGNRALIGEYKDFGVNRYLGQMGSGAYGALGQMNSQGKWAPKQMETWGKLTFGERNAYFTKYLKVPQVP